MKCLSSMRRRNVRRNLVAYASIILAVIENLIVNNYQQKSETEKAVRTNKIGRWLIPTFFIIFSVGIYHYYLG